MAPQPTMHSRSTGVYSGIAVPMSPNATAGPFATPPGSHIAHAPTRSATSSPGSSRRFRELMTQYNALAGPSVLQIGRSVALLDTTGDPGAVSFPRAHSSLSHNTAFSGNSYAITPEGAFAAQVRCDYKRHTPCCRILTVCEAGFPQRFLRRTSRNTTRQPWRCKQQAERFEQQQRDPCWYCDRERSS